MPAPNVTFIRKELSLLFPQYDLIADCLAGETKIKERKTKYLPMPNAADQSEENIARYKAYLARAVFVNVTRRTLAGLIGEVFNKEPEVKVNTLLDKMVADVTGQGVSLKQQSRKALSFVLAYSRGGLALDFPASSATKQELDNGAKRPVLTLYGPKQIVNWRVYTDGSGLEKLSMITIAEGWPYHDDGFEIKYALCYKVYKLTPEGVIIEIYKENTPSTWDGFTIKEKPGSFTNKVQFALSDFNGAAVTEIPFWFLGSENNDANPDLPNFYDLASLNVAHYRNSADYEENLFVSGQATPFVSGLTDTWLKDVLGGKLAFGSVGGIPGPVGSDAKLLEMKPNGALLEAMKHKESQMVALGAKLVEQKQVQRTAYETGVQTKSETSILATSANNVSESYTKAIKFALKYYYGVDDNESFIKLNTSFNLSTLTPEGRTAIISSWKDGAISWLEMRMNLRNSDVSLMEDKTALAEIETSKEQEAERQIKINQSQTKVNEDGIKT